MCVLVRVKLKKLPVSVTTCFYDYGSALKNAAKLDRNIDFSPL